MSLLKSTYSCQSHAASSAGPYCDAGALRELAEGYDRLPSPAAANPSGNASQ
jgi:hypothetical protein